MPSERRGRLPRYNTDGIGDAHALLAKMFVQYGRGVDRGEFISSTKLLDGSDGYPFCNRPYIADRIHKWTSQANSPTSRWVPPNVNDSLIFSTFQSNPIIQTLIERTNRVSK